MGANKSFYYGEIPKRDFMMLLSEIQKTSDTASNVINRYCQITNNSYFLEHAIGNKRGLAINLFDDLTGKRVLDYGCGLGSLGIEAIKNGAIVTFADSSWDRLKMASHLTVEVSELSKHKFVALDDIKKVYDLKETYDLIILNGLLEWLPSVKKATFFNAKDIQIDFLKDCKTLLNSSGRIFIGMENRYAFIYQIGYPEDHTGILGLSIMNRTVANEKHKNVKKTDFVNFTWSFDDYYYNANAIQMEVEKITGMFPDYRFPERILDLNNCDSKALIECILLEKIIHPPVQDYSEYIEYLGSTNRLKFVVYSYGVILKQVVHA